MGAVTIWVQWFWSPGKYTLTVSPSICHEVMRLDVMILVFWILSFKPTFSLSVLLELKKKFYFWFISLDPFLYTVSVSLHIFLCTIFCHFNGLMLQVGKSLKQIVCVCAQLLSHIQLFVMLWTASPPASSVHGIFQTRILEWVAISSFRGSAWSSYRTCISCVPCIGR